MPFLHAFVNFPDEAALVGRMLAGYADLEISLMHCVQVARADLDSVLKVMYRTRGETARIHNADALGRQKYRNLQLGPEFESAIAAMKHCMSIRNQYAHCAWYGDNTGQLAFVNLEEIAFDNDVVEDLRDLTTRHVNVDLLTRQLNYFQYTEALLVWVNYEGRHRAGRPPMPGLQRPAYLALPPKYVEE